MAYGSGCQITQYQEETPTLEGHKSHIRGMTKTFQATLPAQCAAHIPAVDVHWSGAGLDAVESIQFCDDPVVFVPCDPGLWPTSNCTGQGQSSLLYLDRLGCRHICRYPLWQFCNKNSVWASDNSIQCLYTYINDNTIIWQQWQKEKASDDNWYGQSRTEVL